MSKPKIIPANHPSNSASPWRAPSRRADGKRIAFLAHTAKDALRQFHAYHRRHGYPANGRGNGE